MYLIELHENSTTWNEPNLILNKRFDSLLFWINVEIGFWYFNQNDDDYYVPQ